MTDRQTMRYRGHGGRDTHGCTQHTGLLECPASDGVAELLQKQARHAEATTRQEDAAQMREYRVLNEDGEGIGADPEGAREREKDSVRSCVCERE
jgi:hypothetical protein